MPLLKFVIHFIKIVSCIPSTIDSQNTSLHTTTQKKAQNFNLKPSQIVKEPKHFIQIPKLWFEEEKKSQNLMMKLKD
jgi:hypothetical protein